MNARAFLLLCGAVALVGLAATALGLVLDRAATVQAMHPAGLFWLALSAGALPLLMIPRLTGGLWGEASEPLARAIAAPLPLAVLAYLLMLALGMQGLFAWTQPVEALPEIVQRKTLYLNIPFFAVRTLVVLAVWLALAAALGVWSAGRPSRGTPLAAGGLILWVLTMTIFAYDWIMSLEPRWYSDILGMILCVGSLVSAMAVVVLLARMQGLPMQAMFDFASLWLAAILGWAFLSFVQYLIIWMGNIPHEIDWFLHRSAGGWRMVSWLMVLLFAALPFAMLLSGRLKRHGGALMAVALIVLAGHALHVLWLVLPSFHREGFFIPWQTYSTWFGLGGLWVGWVAVKLLPGKALPARAGGREGRHG